MLSLKRTVTAASAALFLTAGTAWAGLDPVDVPMEPQFVFPYDSSTMGPTGAEPGSAEAIAATLETVNAVAVQVLGQGVPPLTASQRAAALARLAEVIAVTGGSPELSALVAAVDAAPAAE